MSAKQVGTPSGVFKIRLMWSCKVVFRLWHRANVNVFHLIERVCSIDLRQRAIEGCLWGGEGQIIMSDGGDLYTVDSVYIYTVYAIVYTHGFYWGFCVILSVFMHSFWVYSLIFFRVASLALGQSYDCPSASEATLWDMGEFGLPHKNTIKHDPCAQLLRCIVLLDTLLVNVWDAYVCARVYQHLVQCAHLIEGCIMEILGKGRAKLSCLMVVFYKPWPYHAFRYSRGHVQYIPLNMYRVLLCFALFWACYWV